MLTVDHFARIRQARRDGLTIRQIAEQFGHSPKTILKASANPSRSPTRSRQPRPAPVFGPFRPFVDDILAADETAPPQAAAHRARSSAGCVAEHGYPAATTRSAATSSSGASTAARRSSRSTIRPGIRAEADFGHIHVDFPDGRRLVPVLIVTWSYSNCAVRHRPADRADRGHPARPGRGVRVLRVRAARTVVGQPKTVAIHIFSGRERTLHPRYAALASHYTVHAASSACRRRATEKPRVEKRVLRSRSGSGRRRCRGSPTSPS